MTKRNLLEECGSAAPSRLPCFHSIGRRLLALIVGLILVSGLAGPALSQTKVVPEGPRPLLRASDLFALKERCSSTAALKESFQLTRKHVYGPEFKPEDILAFEENRFFIYAVGDASNAYSTAQGGPQAEEAPRFVRRFLFLKPSTFVIDDHVRAPASGRRIRWLLRGGHAPEIAGRRIRLTQGDNELLCETLLPKNATLKNAGQAEGKKQPTDYRVKVRPQGDSAEVRFLHLLHTRSRGEEDSTARAQLVEKDGRLQLTVSTKQRVFRLTLASGGVGADEIAVSTVDGETLLPGRLLPAGILPYGPEGTRLLERWDAAYRGDRRPGWDTGRPSSELKKAVEDGTLRPCRAVVLGCGSGTNAVYLAGKGFDVTAIDIAPTALNRAEQKARKAGVEVRWLFADVLAPPDLEPFDLIYDRGCYHGVRRQNAAGYVEAVRRLTQPGSRILLLAGNANEPGGGGPPRVKEEELRGDFSELFEFEWLRETRFDTTDPARKGALAWSALLRLKQEP